MKMIGHSPDCVCWGCINQCEACRDNQAELDHLRAEVAEYTKLKEYAKSLGQRTYLELHAENEHWKNEWKKLNVENKILRGENRILHAHSKRMRTACLMRAGYSISELEEMLAKATPPSPETEG